MSLHREDGIGTIVFLLFFLGVKVSGLQDGESIIDFWPRCYLICRFCLLKFSSTWSQTLFVLPSETHLTFTAVAVSGRQGGDHCRKIRSVVLIVGPVLRHGFVVSGRTYTPRTEGFALQSITTVLQTNQPMASASITSELVSYGGGGERGIREWRRVKDGTVASSTTTADGFKFKREWTGSGVDESSVLLSRLFRVRPSSVSLLVRRKSNLRIRLQLDGLPDAIARDCSSPSTELAA